MIRASYLAFAAIGILGTIAYAAHCVRFGDWTPMFAAVVFYGVYAVIFLADALMRMRAARQRRQA